jgi:enamine deaminase RidA (YjgF/YER057c/UK114 family)
LRLRRLAVGRLGPGRGQTDKAIDCRSSSELRGEGALKIERRQVGPRMSKIVVHGDTVYLAGLVAEKTRGKNVGEQTREILATIDKLLAEAGTDKSKILQATIWLQDVRTVDEMNAVWDGWVAPGETPARACIEARLQSPALALEIRVIAAR